MQYVGKATIKVGSITLESLPNATLDLGGDERKPVVGDKGVLGFSTEAQPGMIECEVVLKKGQSLKAYDFSDSTVTFAVDTGQVWSGANAFLMNTLKLTAKEGGKIPLKICSKQFEEVTGA